MNAKSIEHPKPEDRPAWKQYWEKRGQNWRTEPEVDKKRQDELTRFLNNSIPEFTFKLPQVIQTHFEPGSGGSIVHQNPDQELHPLRMRLNRADVEWLLSSRLQSSDSIDREGLDQIDIDWLNLAWADMHEVDLHGLPLIKVSFWNAYMQGTMLHSANLESCNLQDAHLEYANLIKANLKNAKVGGAYFDEALLNEAHLENIDSELQKVSFKRSMLVNAHLEGAKLIGAYFERAGLEEASLEGAYLGGANMKQAMLSRAHLESTVLANADLQQAYLLEAHLEGANLREAHLEKANLQKAYLHGANLQEAHLEQAELQEAHLEGAIMPFDALKRVRKWVTNFPEKLLPANIAGAFLDSTTKIEGLVIGEKKMGFVSVADVHYDGVNLSVVDWNAVKKLGDESEARSKQKHDGSVKSDEERLKNYRTAVRANRQLAVALRDQGLNEEADHLAYRAQLLQRSVWRLQGRWLKFTSSWVLSLLSGYGYRPFWSFLWYLAIISGFAFTYHIFGHLTLSPPDAFIYSLTSFHGRGFFPGLESKPSLHDPLVMLAALEAVVGLFIEISFIASFTQRFFAK